MRFYYLLAVIAISSCTTPKENNSNSKETWTLGWSDEFEYTGLPDSTKWGYDTGGHGWGNRELQYYTRASLDNAEVSDGTLKIKAIHQRLDNCDYTSARLVTRGKADFTYGRMDIRAKLPPGRGLWPAIWMLSSEVGKVSWPECGEIDIMEHVGFEKDSIFGTVHTKTYNHIIGTQKGKKIFIEKPYDSFHIYSLEWTPEQMSFLLDDNLFYTIKNEHKTTAEWPFDSPFYLVLNIAVGGNLGGKMGVDSTVFPATMEVDYVRVYRPADSNASVINSVYEKKEETSILR